MPSPTPLPPSRTTPPNRQRRRSLKIRRSPLCLQLTPLNVAFTPIPILTPSSTAFTYSHRGAGVTSANLRVLRGSALSFAVDFLPSWFHARTICFSGNSRILILLRTLSRSLRSFSRSLPLFSIACALFYKNTRVGVSSCSFSPPVYPELSRGATRHFHPPFVFSRGNHCVTRTTKLSSWSR
jgi:hypothetical protein